MSETKKKLRALFIEDSEDDAELLTLSLRRAGYELESEQVCTREGVLKSLESKPWDIIFSDHSMPHLNSLEALQIRNDKGLDIPFIILSGAIGEDVAVEAMRAGANDYMIKGKTDRLIPAVARELQDAKERELRRKSEQELEYFVASLTHDLRTPLVAELRILELFSQERIGSLNEQQRDLCKELIRSNQFTQYMVNNILYAYKYKQHQIKLNLEATDISQLIRDWAATSAVQSLLEERSQKLILQLGDLACVSDVDCLELQRVILNLTKNAVNFSPRTSNIYLSTERVEGKIRVSVRDEGPGVDPEIIPHLFTPYATSPVKKYRHVGAGLGLFLSQQVIDAHNGQIHFENLPDGGALFYFDLPCKAP